MRRRDRHACHEPSSRPRHCRSSSCASAAQRRPTSLAAWVSRRAPSAECWREPGVRYENERPRDLLHIDTRKLGRIERPSHRVTGNRRDSVVRSRLPAADQRQSRALHPVGVARVGLRLDLPKLRPANTRPGRLAVPLLTGSQLAFQQPFPASQELGSLTLVTMPKPVDRQTANEVRCEAYLLARIARCYARAFERIDPQRV